MTQVGQGGVVIVGLQYLKTFKKDFSKLTPDYQNLVESKLKDILKNPRPSGLKFEKLKGYKNPDIYTIHVTGNYKISFAINGDEATLRRVGNHNYIDRTP